MKISRLINCAALFLGAALTVTIAFIVEDDQTQYQMMLAILFINAKIIMDIIVE